MQKNRTERGSFQEPYPTKRENLLGPWIKTTVLKTNKAKFITRINNARNSTWKQINTASISNTYEECRKCSWRNVWMQPMYSSTLNFLLLICGICICHWDVSISPRVFFLIHFRLFFFWFPENSEIKIFFLDFFDFSPPFSSTYYDILSISNLGVYSPMASEKRKQIIFEGNFLFAVHLFVNGHTTNSVGLIVDVTNNFLV